MNYRLDLEQRRELNLGDLDEREKERRGLVLGKEVVKSLKKDGQMLYLRVMVVLMMMSLRN
jgi:hypothetical protein